MAELDFEFVEEVPEELTCSICMKWLCEPHLTNCCEKKFCKDCLEEWLERSYTCPTCRSTSFSHIFMQSTNRRIQDLKVYCPNAERGCQAILKIGECEEHLSTTNNEGCPYTKLQCPYHCPAEIFRCRMDTHLKKECPKRHVSCYFCKLQGEFQYIARHHKGECPKYPVRCPQGCTDTVLRKDLKAHREICPMEPVACPFGEFGCKAELRRRDRKRHLEDGVVEHLAKLARSHAALQAEHEALKKEYDALKVSRLSRMHGFPLGKLM